MLVLSETEIRARVIGTMSLLSPVCIVCCVCVWVVSRDVICMENVMRKREGACGLCQKDIQFIAIKTFYTTNIDISGYK